MSFFRYHPFSRLTFKPSFWLIYTLSVIFNFHGLLVAYSNSTYMERFAAPEVIGALYTIGSALSVLFFLFITQILGKLGNVKLALALSILEIVALVTLGFAPGAATTIIAFVVFLTVNPLLYLTIDIFSESLIGENEGATGRHRGLALTLMSLASVCGPLALALIVGSDDGLLYRSYLVSAGIFAVFVAIIALCFRDFIDPPYQHLRVRTALSQFWANANIRYVLSAHFCLQIFFSWMVIYFPLYLATELGFTWEEIGTIIAVGLFAYVLVEYPAGLLADQKYGEQEMMAIGFLILIITVAGITALGAAPAGAFMALMFASRIGASLVEVTTESYFFKQIKAQDANVISFFRLTRPLAMLFGALLGSAALLYLPFSLAFLVLALALVPALFLTSRIVDTR